MKIISRLMLLRMKKNLRRVIMFGVIYNGRKFINVFYYKKYLC